jgi:hypothetical protein
MATQPITSRVLNSQQQRLEGQQASQAASAANSRIFLGISQNYWVVETT